MPFIGGKAQSGTWQKIINLIPPHSVFLEPFGGDAAISRRKKLSVRTVIIEKSAAVADNLLKISGVEVVCGCGIDFLRSFKFTGGEFVYADPPYVLSARDGREYYEHELSDADHNSLLRVLFRLPCPVLLSGYPSQLYERAGLSTENPRRGWQCVTFPVMTRGHTWRTECLWFNYPRPKKLHDLSHVGANFRERWRIEKRRRNWSKRLAKLEPLERETLFACLVDVMTAEGMAAEPTRAIEESQ